MLVGQESLAEPDQARVEVLAAEIARHGRAVVLVGQTPMPMAEPLVGSTAGAAYGDNGTRAGR